MRGISNLLIITGVILLGIFGYQLYSYNQAEKQSLAIAEERIKEQQTLEASTNSIQQENSAINFTAEFGEAFALFEIPKLGKTLPVVEGTDAASLKKGVGHLSESVFPGQNEQILLSGHRDTVFRNFGELEIGDTFIVHMPYGTFTYEIRETEIVPEDDTSVIRKMGEEVLVVTTCYPFRYVGNAPDRFIFYAYPSHNHLNAS